MKKYIVLALFTAATIQLKAQDVNKDIQQADVERIIKNAIS